LDLSLISNRAGQVTGYAIKSQGRAGYRLRNKISGQGRLQVTQ